VLVIIELAEQLRTGHTLRTVLGDFSLNGKGDVRA
jgi:hypothetical protein